MKENWTYKKLEDCIEKLKYTTKIQSSDYKSEGLFPIVSQEDEMISGYWDNASDVFKVNKPLVIFGDHTRVLKYVDFDFVLGADGVKILQPIDGLIAKFFLYYLKWCKIPSLGYSRHYKLLKEIDVPIPPLSEQSRIVSELDLLQSIIDKQKAQLKELDNLAQAVFYDMFGDPVENDKGWEVKKVSEFAEITDFVANGSFATLRENVAYSDGVDYAILVRMVDNSNGFDKEKFVYVSESSYNFLEKSKLFGGEIIMNNVGARLGLSFICPNLNQPMTLGPNSILIRTNCNVFNQRMFSLQSSIDYIRSISGNTAMPKFNKTEFKKLVFIQPPLHIQQSFAKKIHAIEKQKTAITQSITETEKLFDYTMDKYFG